ncbi:hypothetical protein BS78_02G116900 [Paspalum vaginatum]|nr:hypothetical protein BS78_02G116900 [Paspalum vaginatum]
MLLEVITGKSPLEQCFSGEMNLTKWVQDNFPHRAHEVIDKRLISSEEMQESNTNQLLMSLLIPMTEVALSCVLESPDERSSIHDSLLRLKQIKESFSISRTSQVTASQEFDSYQSGSP